MKRAWRLLVALLPLACGNPVDPSPLYGGYFLSKVDDQLLPVPFGNDGTLLLAGGLAFKGTVSYSTLTRRPDQSAQNSIVELNYTISEGVLHIDLCPPLAQCLVSSELVGPILGRFSELVLTHYLAGNPGSVYHFFPALAD